MKTAFENHLKPNAKGIIRIYVIPVIPMYFILMYFFNYELPIYVLN